MYRCRLFFLIVLCMLIAGCGASSSTGYTLVKAGTLKPGERVPPPSGPVILSITGNITVTNVGNQLDLDLEILERLDLVQYATYDAGIRRRATYQGVLLQHVLDLAGAAADATNLHTWALDEYETDIPPTVTQWPVMIATSRDGQRMERGDKGPIEVVFPYDSFDIDQTTYDPKWVWMLRRIDVR